MRAVLAVVLLACLALEANAAIRVSVCDFVSFVHCCRLLAAQAGVAKVNSTMPIGVPLAVCVLFTLCNFDVKFLQNYLLQRSIGCVSSCRAILSAE